MLAPSPLASPLAAYSSKDLSSSSCQLTKHRCTERLRVKKWAPYKGARVERYVWSGRWTMR